MKITSYEDITQSVYDSVDDTLRVTLGSGEDDVLVDEASATITYVGRATPGSNPASSVWQVKKISVAGNVTTIAWAEGNTKYEHVWNDRATITYNTY